ncbi:transposase domain protein [Shigella flexneri K-304]|nr:transposase domain protein [Shigella flexneri K-304]
MPCFTAMRAEIALMSGSAFAVTHHAFSSGAGRTSDGNGSHASTLKSPSCTKSVSWQHYPAFFQIHHNLTQYYAVTQYFLHLRITLFF